MNDRDALEFEVHKALLQAATHDRSAPPDAAVETIETHVSWLYLTATTVLKRKKPQRLAFLDASTPERRRFLCEEEVRLNRRLAEGVYLGVVPIVRRAGGGIAIGGAGEVLDWAVRMKRLPAERMLDRLLERGEVDNRLLERLVDVLLGFDATAARGPEIARHGRLDALRDVVLCNVAEIAERDDEVVRTRRPRLEHLRRWLAAFLDEHGARLDRRAREGRVREGHGDLHAGNVCVLPDRIVIYDCIEFAPAFRCIDAAAELAFLAMDLERRGFRGFSAWLLRRYAKRAGDPELPALAAFYRVHYALVRAKVALLRARDARGAELGRSRVEAREGLDLAVSGTLPPSLVITCGLPGTGKSTMAKRLADHGRARVLRSDVVRKRLEGIAPATRAAAGDRQGIYAPEKSDETYAALLAAARASLAAGRPVVVDAAFPDPARRAPFAALAREGGFPFVCVHCSVPASTVRARLAARARDPREVSDADLAVYEAARTRFVPPDEFAAAERVEAGEGDPGEWASAVLDRVVEQAARGPAATP